MWIAITIAVIAVILFLLLRSSGDGGGLGSRFPMGSRAWEAELTLDALLTSIKRREEERDVETDEAKRERMDRQIAFLRAQIAELQAIIDAKDTSPGKGYVGFKAPPDE
jgi:hypothetical protein